MSVKKRIRRAMAFFLAFVAVCTMFAGDLNISRAEESGGENAGPREEAGAEEVDGPDEEPEGIRQVQEKFPQEETDRKDREASLTEVLDAEEKMVPDLEAGIEETLEGEQEVEPEEDIEEITEPLPEDLAENEDEPVQKFFSDSDTTYPLYVTCQDVSLLENVDNYVRSTSNKVHRDMETDTGGTISTQHRSMMGILCSGCKQVNYRLLPSSFAEISVQYSDPSMIEDTNYLVGRWNEDELQRDTGCLQLNSKIRKPGITDVDLSYCIQFADYYEQYLYNHRCFSCPALMPYSRNRYWFRYKESYRITAYADYILRYDANAGDEKVEHMPSFERDRVCADSMEMIISAKKPERTGYDFVGWAEKKTASLPEYKPQSPITLDWTEGKTVEKTLYAVWQKVVPGIDTSPEVPDLTFIKKACQTDAVTSVVSVETGETFSYVITIKNNADHEILDLNISEVFDENLIQLLNTPNHYKNGIWTIDSLKSGETATLLLQVKALAECPEYENTIHVSMKKMNGSYQEVPPGEDDIPSAVVEIRAAPELMIQKKADLQRAKAGERITYTITVKNPGNTTAKNVKIIDPLPDSLKWESASLQKQEEGKLEDVASLPIEKDPEDHIYDAGDLKAGEAVILTITAEVLETKEEFILNVADAHAENGPKVRDSAHTDIQKIEESKAEKEPGDTPPLEEEKVPETLLSVPEQPARPVSFVPLRFPNTTVPSILEEYEEQTEDSRILHEEAEAKETKVQSDMPVKIADPGTPLGHRGRHLCCILHFVILLLALIVEIFYTKSMKKHQKKIFELREELAELEFETEKSLETKALECSDRRL